MAKPKSRRGRILLNLERQLKTISIANGYATDIVNATTKVKIWTDTAEAECPVLYIVDENTSSVYGAGRNLQREWTIGVYGVMKNKDQISMEELIADIEDCAFRNQTLSFDGEIPGPAAEIRIGQIITDNQLFSEFENSQLFKVTLLIKYTACADNPR